MVTFKDVIDIEKGRLTALYSRARFVKRKSGEKNPVYDKLMGEIVECKETIQILGGKV